MSARRPSKDEDKRIQKSKQAVLAATYALLTETGLGGLSVDAVAAKSGVAKTTIYRHWASRSALVLDACSQLSAKREAPDTGSLRGDLMLLAGDLARRLGAARWSRVLPSIVDAAERDAEVAEMHSRLHKGLMEGFRAAIERAKERRELPAGYDVSQVLAAIVGPLFYRRWFSREALDDGFVKAVVEGVIGNAKVGAAPKRRRA
jgi:AcrR family transcriptional regulator